MGVVKECTLENIFGDLDNFIVRTNMPNYLTEGMIIDIVNADCEFEYDSILKEFKPTMYAYIVSLDLIDVDLSDYIPNKCVKDGKYGYATAKVKKIKESGY